MTLITAEISAAPHLPWTLRGEDVFNKHEGSGASPYFSNSEMIELNDEVLPVSHAAVTE